MDSSITYSISNNLTFEDAIQQLDLLVSKMEKGDASLDDSLTLFKEGIQLIQYCQAHLSKHESTIDQLTKQIAIEANNQKEC